MYVEQFTPQNLKPNHKIILIHGGGQTGVGFLSTPDGRRGWAHDFLFAGFEVFVVDQPGTRTVWLFIHSLWRIH